MRNIKWTINEGVTFEPHRIETVDLNKAECAYVNDMVRISNRGYLRLYPADRKFSVGDFLFYRTRCGVGKFARIKDILFLEERVINFYV